MSRTAAEFIARAKAQAGDRYIYGAEVRLNDPNPRIWDCSELTQWAAYQVGLELPDGAMNQLAFCHRHGTSHTVAEGLRTPGMLLFHGPSRPHVAISLGNGYDVEAPNRSKPVGVYRATGRAWTHAAWVPGMVPVGQGAAWPIETPPPNPLAVARFMINLSKRKVIGPGATTKGDPVKWCQVLLNAKLHGHLNSGVYDHETMQSILWFQVTVNNFLRATGKPAELPETGVCEARTWARLDTPT